MASARRWILRITLGTGVLLVAAVATIYLCLDPIMSWVTQRRLDKLEGMVGTFQKVHVTVWPPGYDIYRAKIIEKPLVKGKAPLAYAERVEMKWSWHELLKGRLVRRIKIWGGKFTIVTSPGVETPKEKLARQVKDKLPPPESLDKRLEAMQEFRLERLEFVDTQVVIIDRHDKGQPKFWVHDIQATVENFATRRFLTYGKPTIVAARMHVQRSGELEVFVTADPLDKGLSFGGQVELRHLDLTELYQLVIDKTKLKIPRGTFDMFASFQCKRGVLTGGIKPVLSNLDVKAAEPGLGPRLKAALADLAVRIFSDRVPGRNAVATIIPIHGDLRRPQLELWPTVLAVIRNAFVEGLSTSLTNTPPPEAAHKESIFTQARRALSRKKGPPVKAQPEKKQ